MNSLLIFEMYFIKINESQMSPVKAGCLSSPYGVMDNFDVTINLLELYNLP